MNDMKTNHDDETMMTPTKLSEAVQTAMDGVRNHDLDQAGDGFQVLFEEVQDPEHWKNPIDAKIDLDQFSGHDIWVVRRAFHQAVQTFVSGTVEISVEGRQLRVRWAGYYGDWSKITADDAKADLAKLKFRRASIMNF